MFRFSIPARYSLRSLFIAITLFCVALAGISARVEYLRRRKEFYKQEAKRLEIILLENPRSERLVRQYGVRYKWYQQLAGQYHKAMFRPWTTVDDTPPKILLAVEKHLEGPIPASEFR
jgi:hypothetical protein